MIFTFSGCINYEGCAILSIHNTRHGAELAQYEWETRCAIQGELNYIPRGDRYTGDWVYTYDRYTIRPWRVESDLSR